jgi:hypothetical protein
MEAKEMKLQAEVAELKAKVTGLEAQLQRHESLIANLQNPTPKIANDIQPKLINGMPTSCAELKSIGHIWSGLYSVMGVNMVETIYCDFTKAVGDPGKPKIDVNSTPTRTIPNSTNIPIW